MDIGNVPCRTEKYDPQELSEGHQSKLGWVEGLQQQVFGLVKRQAPLQPAVVVPRLRGDQVTPALGRGDDDLSGRPSNGHSRPPVFERLALAVLPFRRFLGPERDRHRGNVVLQHDG